MVKQVKNRVEQVDRVSYKNTFWGSAGTQTHV